MTNINAKLEDYAMVEAMRRQLNAWAHEYYQNNTSPVPDTVYDSLQKHLQALEEKYPELVTKDSPTRKVMGAADNRFRQVKHTTPMLSLYTETDFTEQGAIAFDRRVCDGLGIPVWDKAEYVGELKFDGLALNVRYEKGVMVLLSTRGDGEIGEDVTHNAHLISGLPRFIPNAPEVLEVRGECLMMLSDFIALNEQRQLQGLPVFKNPRNTAAGAMRQLDAEDDRKLYFYAYGIGECSRVLEDTHSANMQMLMDYNINVSGVSKILSGPNDLIAFKEEITQMRKRLNIEIDGVVFKVNSLRKQEQLGWNSREPKWAVAHKFPPTTVVAWLEKIDVQVGRTGRLTPVARLSPVFVGGTTITNVTLHNQFEIRSKGIRLDDAVIVQRAGDVIPEITGPSGVPRCGYVPNFWMPKECPVCGSRVVRLRGKVNHHCTGGVKCIGQREEAFRHFVSRRAMNIQGIGQSAIFHFMKYQLISSFSDLFRLTENMIKSVPGYADGSATNMVKELDAAKHPALWRFLFALGIFQVGENTSRLIAEHFGSLERIMTATYEEFLAIDDIGPVGAKSLVSYFSNPNNQEEIKQLLELGVKPINPVVKAGLPFLGKTAAVTGSFAGFNRDSLKSYLSDVLGYKVVGGVSKSIDVLYAGSQPTARKVKLAQELGIPVITEIKQ